MKEQEPKNDNERLRKLFESIDENGDGKLSPEEVRRFISSDETPADGSQSSSSSSVNTSPPSHGTEKASTEGARGDGGVSEHELDDDTASRMIEVFDDDKDGTIDYREFRKAFEDVEGKLTTQRLRVVWLQRSKENIDFSGNEFSGLLPGGSISLDIDSFRLFLAGGLGGLISRTATSPIERVRLLQQTRGSAFGSTSYILKTIIYQQGIKGLWNGNMANCLKAIPQSALVCLVYGSCVAALEAYNEDSEVSPASRLGVGALAGAFATTCTYPLDVIRAKLAVQLRDPEAFNKVSHPIYTTTATVKEGRHPILHHHDLRGANTPSALPVASRIRPKGCEYLLRARARGALHIARIDDVVKAVTVARQIDPRENESKLSHRPQRLSLSSLRNWWQGFDLKFQPRYSGCRTPAHALASSVSPPLERIPTRYQNRINPASFSKSSLLNGTNIGRLKRGCVRPLCFSYVFPLSARCRGFVPVHPHIVHSGASVPSQSYFDRIREYLRVAKTRAKFFNVSGNVHHRLFGFESRGTALRGGGKTNLHANDLEYKGIFDTCRKIFQVEGYSGLFRGIRPTLVGMTTFIAIQQAGFDEFVEWFHRMFNQEQQNATSTLLASAVAGTMAQTVVHPVDTIRRRIQVAQVRSARRLGFWDISRHVISRHGWRGFYAGLLSTYGKVVPSITISLTVREIALGRLKWS